MKKLLRLSVALLLSLAVLAVSGGFTLSRMACLHSGVMQIGMKLRGCCGPQRNPGTPACSSKCCDIHDQDLSVGNFLGGFSKSAFQQVTALAASSYFHGIPAAATSIPQNHLAARTGHDGPLPDILLLTCKRSV